MENLCCLVRVDNNEPVPLKSIDVDLNIKGFIANIESNLVFMNDEEKPIEAIYKFPIDDSSTVYKFEATINDKVIVTECQEKQEAKEAYEEAIHQGFSAALLEEGSSSDIFSCRIGNIPPKSSALIKFSYVTELILQCDGNLKFVLPTLLNPRYNPSIEKGGVPNPSIVDYVPGTNQPYSFNIKASISSDGKVLNVISEKDKLDIIYDSNIDKTNLKLKEKFIADHDFSFEIKTEKPHEPILVIENGDSNKNGILKQDILMVNFFPEFKETDYTNKHEFYIVIDRSGSMDGSRITEAGESLLLILKSLPAGCYFNIIGFGSTFESLFPGESREYTEETLKIAIEHQKKLAADLGGTEIYEPLKHIYDIPIKSTHSRQILLLTDGEVYNTQSIVQLVGQNSHTTKVFALGIGEGASTSLIKGIARAGKGTFDFVKSGEKMHPIVIRLLKSAMQASVTEVTVDWKFNSLKEKLVQIPKLLPPIFSKDRLIVYALVPLGQHLEQFNDNSSLDSCILKGKIGNRDIELSVRLTKSMDAIKDDNLPIHRLAAKSQIKQLQDEEKKDENKNEIILLSISANVISNHTSMVGIDKSSKQEINEVLKRNVPMIQDPSLKLYSGFAFCSARGGTMPRAMKCSNRMPYAMPMGGNMAMQSSMPLMMSDPCPAGMNYSTYATEQMECDSYEPEFEKVEIVKKPELDLFVLVSLQNFSGFWSSNKELTDSLLLDNEIVIKSAPVDSIDIWTTILVLATIYKHFADQKEEWEIIEGKAKQWLAAQNIKDDILLDLINKANNFIY